MILQVMDCTLVLDLPCLSLLGKFQGPEVPSPALWTCLPAGGLAVPSELHPLIFLFFAPSKLPTSGFLSFLGRKVYLNLLLPVMKLAPDGFEAEGET